MSNRIAKRPFNKKNKPKQIKAPKTLELTFDTAARQDYLTGFSKRKKARAAAAREAAVLRDKEDRVRERKELREKRKTDLEDHVAAIQKEMRRQNRILNGEREDATDAEDSDGDDDEADGWTGISEDPSAAPKSEIEEDEAEYVDEDKFTTVTVEAMDDSAFGLAEDDDDEDGAKKKTYEKEDTGKGARKSSRAARTRDGKPKPKAKKFRYESKAERSATRAKQKSKNQKAAKARRGE